MIDANVKYTTYLNGAIKDADGTLVGFFDRPNGLLHVNGLIKPIANIRDDAHAADTLDAMLAISEVVGVCEAAVSTRIGAH